MDGVKTLYESLGDSDNLVDYERISIKKSRKLFISDLMNNKVRAFMKYALLILVSLSLVFCTRHEQVFLEEDPIGDSVAYFSATVNKPEEAYRIAELKTTREINRRARGALDSYVKVYLNKDGFPLKIENYRRHDFNTHVYYPYLVFVIRDEGGSYAVDVVKKVWEREKLVEQKDMVQLAKREGNFKELMRISLEDKNNKEILNFFYRFKFVTLDNEQNRQVLTAIGFGDKTYIDLEGYNSEYPDVQIKMRFFLDKRSDAVNFQISQSVELRAKLIEFSDNSFLFEYVDVVTQEKKDDGTIKAMEIYGGETD